MRWGGGFSFDKSSDPGWGLTHRSLEREDPTSTYSSYMDSEILFTCVSDTWYKQNDKCASLGTVKSGGGVNDLLPGPIHHFNTAKYMCISKIFKAERE